MFAFTLAEVLITIGIIGVVAALTIPNLIVSYQKRITVNRLKQTYAMIEQAVKLSEAENGELALWNFAQPSNTSFEQYLAKYLKIINKKTSDSLAGEQIYYNEISGTRESAIWIVRSPVEIYTLINGVDIIIEKTSSSGQYSNATSCGLYIDINGINTKPNQLGKDFFSLIVSWKENRRVYLTGTYNTSEYTFEREPNTDRDVLLGKKNPVSGNDYRYQCNKSKKGIWCGRLIQIDGWEISKDYP